MSKPIFSVQVSEELGKQLEELASLRGISKSDVLRDILRKNLPIALAQAQLEAEALTQ